METMAATAADLAAGLISALLWLLQILLRRLPLCLYLPILASLGFLVALSSNLLNLLSYAAVRHDGLNAELAPRGWSTARLSA
jgi:hypothetical protein